MYSILYNLIVKKSSSISFLDVDTLQLSSMKYHGENMLGIESKIEPSYNRVE